MPRPCSGILGVFPTQHTLEIGYCESPASRVCAMLRLVAAAASFIDEMNRVRVLKL